MSKRHRHRQSAGIVLAFLGLALGIAAAVYVYLKDQGYIRPAVAKQEPEETPRQTATAPTTQPLTAPATRPITPTVALAREVTFNRDIAPIIHANCVSCHHERGQAPFPLVTYGDVQKRAGLIAKVTATRYMPPWLPEHGAAEYVGERRLSDEQIAMLQRFAQTNAPQGDGEAPRAAVPSSTWQLGEPDLVVQMPVTYMLPSGGRDVYRNFVVPVSLTDGKWIRAVEMAPGSKSVVHHAFVMFDRTGEARRRDAQDSEMGYPGMSAGADVEGPPGHFLSWQPGKMALVPPPGLQWRLDKGTDMVLQLHMKPTGKPEPVQPSVAFYFADAPPTRMAYALLLRSVDFEIPAGAKDHAVESTYVLPVDAEATAVLPHVHYLGKQLMAWYEKPDGSKGWLLLIKDWNFDWQGDYQFKTPIKLPRGTRLSMRYTFDNSADNPRNPNNPPKAVRYGLNSADEMAELWLQIVPDRPEDYATLVQDYQGVYGIPDGIARARRMLEASPDDPELRLELAIALIKGRRTSAAQEELDKVLAVQPRNARAHYHLGMLRQGVGDSPGAIAAFEQAAAVDPNDYKSLNNAAMLLAQKGELPRAQEALTKAVAVNPNDVLIHYNLGQVYGLQKKFDQSIESLEKALKLDPGNPAVQDWLNRVRAAKAGQR